jgi:superfamily II DNA or RNA helicase
VSVTLRDYQQEAVDSTARALAKHRSALIVSPTGTGKTVMFGALASRAAAKGLKVLVLAERRQLVKQTRQRLREQWGLLTDVEMGNQRAAFGGLPDVIIASVQTLSRRLEGIKPKSIHLIIIDEAHHAVAKQYRKVIDHFSGAYVIGVTATPDRLDGKALGQVFETCAFQYDIRDAIEAGYLTPVKQDRIYVEGIDLSRVRCKGRGGKGDFDDSALAAEYMSPEALAGVAKPLVACAGERPTLVFACTVAHAEALADAIGVAAQDLRAAEWLSGDSGQLERDEALSRFATGQTQYLVNCALFTEGFDAPPTACVAMARPTKSRSLYAQMIGRGFRLYPGKTDLLVLDFVGNSHDHKLITTADVLDGNADAEVSQRCLEITQETGAPVHEALKQAALDIAEQRRLIKLAKARYQRVTIDAFTVLGGDPRPGRWGGAATTPKQREVLTKAGVKDLDKLDRGQASALIDQLVERSSRGLCTYRQALTLAKHGLKTDLTFSEAGAAIDAIAANDWQAPEHFLMDPRLCPTAPTEAGRKLLQEFTLDLEVA